MSRSAFVMAALTASSLCAAPSIINQPTNIITAAGADVVFSVEAEGTAQLHFQWRLNGAVIAGATESSYALEDVQIGALGFYSVVVSNAVASVTSAEAVLSFESAIAFADDFESGTLDNWTVVPTGTSLTNVTDYVNPNSTHKAKLSTSLDKMHRRLVPNVDGRARFSFWMYDTNQPRAFGEIRGFNGGIYTDSLVQLLAIGMYNSATMPGETYSGSHFQGRVFSATNAGWLTLNHTNAPRRTPAAWHEFVIERPWDGTYVDFYVDGVWSRRITGVTPAAWDYVTIGSVAAGGAAPGNAWFDNVKVEYYDPPIFLTQPHSQAANPGDTVILTANASGGVHSYQWRFNGVAITDATNSALTLANVDTTNAGSYSVVVINGVGPALSANAVLSLTDLSLPFITTQPTNLSVIVGSNASFTVTATGAEPLAYAWFKITANATNALANGGNISGADTTNLNISSVSASDAAIYRVTVSNAADTVTSSNAILTVTTPPIISAQPQPQTVLANQNATLNVTASGSGLSYQWYFEGSILGGATMSSFTLFNAQPAQAGNYSVIVSNSAGITPSAEALVSVHYYLTARGSGGSILKDPLQLSYAPGTQVTLTAAPTPNYVFLNWSGDASGTNNPTTVTMTSHKTVTAIFSNAVPDGPVIRDGNIDPWNLGKGDWIYFLSAATNRLGGNVPSVTNENSLMLWYKKHGIRYLIVKAGDNHSLFNGSYTRPQFSSNLVDIAHLHGLLIFGYNRSYGVNIPGEVAIADHVFNQGADGFVFDAEMEWEQGNPWITNAPLQAWQLCGAVRTNWPNKFLACNTFAIISIHDQPSYSFPYRQFGYWCDSFMPMIYHYNWSQRSPSGAVNWTDVGWNIWQNTCAHPTNNPTTFLGSTVYWTNAIKPHAPVNHVYGPNPPNGGVNELEPEDVTEWMDYLTIDPHCPTPGGYKGFSFWRADLHGAQQWENIQTATAGDFPGIVNNIVMDDNQATFVGPWTHVRTFYNGFFFGVGGGDERDTNSFGTNYVHIAQGTGSSHAQFTPNIIVPGDYDVYQWHVKRSEASASVPFQINFNGGSSIVHANQQTNDGDWTLLGRFNFAVGTNGNIQILDNIPEADGIAIADGVKLVFVPKLEIHSQSAMIRLDGHLQFDFSSALGDVVEVQARESLTSGDWETLVTMTNDTGVATFIDPTASGTNQFYRLRQVP